jgi:hypothetical protein
LVLCLEEDFIVRLKDGSNRNLVNDSGPRKYYVKDGIVWQLYTTSSIRSQVARECIYDSSGFGNPSNFRFEDFRYDYVEANSGKDALGEHFGQKVLDEIDVRFYRKNGPSNITER